MRAGWSAGLVRGATRVLATGGLLLATMGPCLAATEGAPHLDGAELGLLWGVPFAGILLSIALFPLLAPRFWHHHFGKVSAFWALCVLVPFVIVEGFALTLYELVHLLLLEYLPFIILLFALFTVAGGVRVTGSLRGTPLVNTAMLALGTVLASLMGTTGAAMLLIRPMIRANDWRQRKTHVLVFFIFLVANIGGALTRGDKVELRGFGSFKVKSRRPRQARNPRTGDSVAVPAKRVPYFKASNELKARLNGGGGDE